MSTIKSSSEHLTLNADGASKDIKFQANGVEKASISSAGAFTSTTIDATALTGNLPAIDGSSLTGITTGNKRNFIIDGDFTQWPEGTSRVRATGEYASALFEYNGHTTANWNANRSTTVPTVAESSYQSKYSLELDVTTADASPSNASYYEYFYHITGTDYSSLHGQEVTLSFWHRHTVTGTYCIHFQNSAGNRHYLAEYTQTTTNTWEKASITLTLDTSGTWLFDDTDIGLTITFVLEAGSDWHGTAGAWRNTNEKSTANQVNGLSSVSNYMYFSQVQLTLGSNAPTFTSPPIATVKDQVEYYIQVFGGNLAYDHIASGLCRSTTSAYINLHFSPKRVIPAISNGSGTASHYSVMNASGGVVACSSANVYEVVGKDHCRLVTTHSSGLVAGNCGILRNNNNVAGTVIIDARH